MSTPSLAQAQQNQNALMANWLAMAQAASAMPGAAGMVRLNNSTCNLRLVPFFDC